MRVTALFFFALLWALLHVCSADAHESLMHEAPSVESQRLEESLSVFTDEIEDEEEDEEKVELPPPPSQNLELPTELSEEIKNDFEEAYALYVKSRSATEERSRKKAIRDFRKLTKKIPTGQAHYYLCILYQWDKDYRKARKVIEQALEANPGFYELYVELGDVEVHEKKRPKAIPHYEKALEIYPYFDYGLDRMMTVLVQLGRFEDAIPYIKRAKQHGESPLRLECEKVARFAIDGPDWGTGYRYESENYIVHSDVSTEFAKTFSDTAELIRDLYDVMFPEISKPDRKYDVYVFKDRAGYLAAGAPPASAGVYMSLARKLMLYRTENIEDALMTMKHEGFHQYCHEYLDNIPSWFNEGLADYFAASELVMVGGKRKMRIIPNRKRIQYLGRALRGGSYPPLSSLMKMTQREMYDVENGGKSQFLHYCMAWSICYFSIQSGQPKYQSALKNYFKALRKGENQLEAYQGTYGKLNMQRFQKDWRDYMLKVSR